MKRLLLLLVFLFALAAPIAAQDSVSTANVNTLIFRGRSSAPSLSTSTQAVIYFDTATGRLRISEAGGAYANVVGAGVPAGADTQVQFNDAGAYGGDAGLTYNKTTNFLTVTNGGITLSTSTINKITITAPATGATLTLADGKTVTVNNTLTFVGTDGTTHTFPNASSTVAEVGFANVFTTSQAFQPATDVISLVVRRNGAAQTANVVEIQTELNALLVGIDKTGAFAFPDNVRQTFNPGADASGLNVGAIAGDPGTPSNGDVWYDSTANELTARINGSNVSLGAGGTPGGANTQIQYNNAGAFGGITGATSDGTSVTFGSGNLLATSPKITTGINDANGNELFLLTATGSAVNELTYANAATGSNPRFTASGSDANIGIDLASKGTGVVRVVNTGTNTPTVQFLQDATLRGFVSWDSSLPGIRIVNSDNSDIVLSTTNTGRLLLDDSASQIMLTSAWAFVWGSSGMTTPDVGFSRPSVNTILVNNASTGVGNLLHGRKVTAKTGDYIVLATDTNTFFTNAGAAGGITFTMVTPAAGLTYEFYRDANQTVTIDIAAGVTIRIGTSVTTDGGNVTLDAVGSKIRITAVSTTQWVGELTGTATFN